MMDELIEILNDINPDVDYENCSDLVKEGILDSFSMVMLVAAISQQMDINIPPDQIIPENFRSVQTIYDLITRAAEDD